MHVSAIFWQFPRASFIVSFNLFLTPYPPLRLHLRQLAMLQCAPVLLQELEIKLSHPTCISSTGRGVGVDGVMSSTESRIPLPFCVSLTGAPSSCPTHCTSFVSTSPFRHHDSDERQWRERGGKQRRPYSHRHHTEHAQQQFYVATKTSASCVLRPTIHERRGISLRY
jgi:hypothetical protein